MPGEKRGENEQSDGGDDREVAGDPSCGPLAHPLTLGGDDAGGPSRAVTQGSAMIVRSLSRWAPTVWGSAESASGVGRADLPGTSLPRRMRSGVGIVRE